MEDASETFKMIDSQEVTEQELKVLRGDAVDNSLYSSSWVLSTLMSLCEIHKSDWSKELEEKLCLLWDQSMESEMVTFLYLHNFHDIVREILETHTEPRLIEIILGITSNICCNSEVVDKMSNDKNLARQILIRLTSNDTPILIQLVRILQAIAYRIEQNPESNWKIHLKECAFFGDCLIFILNSSTNDELLKAAVILLNSISRIEFDEDFIPQKNFLKELFNIKDLIPALLESFMQVIPAENDHSLIELKFIKSWLEVLNVIMNFDLPKFIEDYGNDENVFNSNIMEIIFRILQPYKESYNLYPIEPLNMDVIHETICILMTFRYFNINIQLRIDFITAAILYSLRKTDLEKVQTDPTDVPKLTLRKLLKAYWLQLSRCYTKECIIEILQPCEDNIRAYIVLLLHFYSKMEPKTLEIEKEMEKIIADFQNI